MKNLFHGYYDPSKEELQSLWDDAAFVLDTNTLLNLYRYSDSTRDDFLILISRLKDNIIIPYQVAKEFFENRITVIFEQINAYRELHNEIIIAEEQLKKSVQKLRKHPTLDKSEVQKKVNDAFDSLKKDIESLEGKHPDLTHNDYVLERLTEILSEKLRTPAPPDQQNDAEKWAEDRFNKGIPPGTADKNKTGDKKFGDGLIWHEILAITKELGRPIVFVTDDAKDDWWLRVNGKTIGPRPELRQEFFSIANQRFHMYRTEQFMKFGSEHFKLGVNDETLTEAAFVRELSKESYNNRDANSKNKQRGSINLTDHYNSLLNEQRTITELLESSRGHSSHLTKDLILRLKRVNIAIKEIERAIQPETSPQKSISRAVNFTPVFAQEFYAVDDDFQAIGDVENINATNEEIDLMRESQSPTWLGRLSGYYQIIDL